MLQMSETTVELESRTDPAHGQLRDRLIGSRALATREIRAGDVRTRRVTGYSFCRGLDAQHGKLSTDLRDGSRARGSSHMGRGRAKAKQTKVARELKYNAPQTDLAALQAELSGQAKSSHDEDEDYAEYDEYATYDEDAGR